MGVQSVPPSVHHTKQTHHPPQPLPPKNTNPGINTLAYVLCCLPAALSQLAKERAITHFGQPMNVRVYARARVCVF